VIRKGVYFASYRYTLSIFDIAFPILFYLTPSRVEEVSAPILLCIVINLWLNQGREEVAEDGI